MYPFTMLIVLRIKMSLLFTEEFLIGEYYNC